MTSTMEMFVVYIVYTVYRNRGVPKSFREESGTELNCESSIRTLSSVNVESISDIYSRYFPQYHPDIIEENDL